MTLSAILSYGLIEGGWTVGNIGSLTLAALLTGLLIYLLSGFE